MKRVQLTDSLGRHSWVELPDGVPESEAGRGVLVGPPPVVDSLGLPEPLATRLHNELFSRGLLNYREAQRNPQTLFGALQSALRLDAVTLTNAFHAYEQDFERGQPSGGGRPQQTTEE